MRHIVDTSTVSLHTKGFGDAGDINNKVAKILRKSAVKRRFNFSRKNGGAQ